MQLFINAGVCERKWNGNVKISELPSARLKLSIPNYMEYEKKQEFIRFILPDINEKALEKDLLLNNVLLRRLSKNAYYIERTEKQLYPHMYALLRNAEVVSDDIFIPVTMKDKVEVIKRIRFVDDEVDYGQYLSNVYLIKIKLNVGESLPVYLTYDEPDMLREHYVFYKTNRDTKYHVSEKFETLILLNEKNKDEYISLSRLW